MQQCITDIEGLIPGVEKVIADLKAGNQTAAILELAILKPKAEAAYKECTGSSAHKAFTKIMDVLNAANPEDLPTCISDIEGLIPGVEGLIADFKAGNYEKALTDGLAMVPDLEKALTDCTASKSFEKVGDMQQCITDIEGLIPGVEKVIADLKAGNQNAAIL
jgi:hypothetical protein